MKKQDKLVVFSLDCRHFGIALSAVERVVHAVEITPLPNAPDRVLGVIDVQGRAVPVVNTRARLGLPPRAIGRSDRFIIAETSGGTVSLVVDEVIGLVETEAIDGADGGVPIPEKGCIDRVTRSDEGIILVCDLDSLIDSHELEALGSAGV